MQTRHSEEPVCGTLVRREPIRKRSGFGSDLWQVVAAVQGRLSRANVDRGSTNPACVGDKTEGTPLQKRNSPTQSQHIRRVYLWLGKLLFSSSTMATNLRSSVLIPLMIACTHRFAIGLRSYGNPAKGRMLLAFLPFSVVLPVRRNQFNAELLQRLPQRIRIVTTLGNRALGLSPRSVLAKSATSLSFTCIRVANRDACRVKQTRR